MHQATLKIAGVEITAEILDKILALFQREHFAGEVKISLIENQSAPPTPSERFEELFKLWKAETAPLSSGSAITTHSAYQQIIEMGNIAVPFILIKLMEDPQHLFFALYKITGENPVKENHAGNFQAMIDDWLAWGKQKGYLS